MFVSSCHTPKSNSANHRCSVSWRLWLVCQRRCYWCCVEDQTCGSRMSTKVVKCGCKTTKCIKGGCSCLTNKLLCTDMCRCKDCGNGKDDNETEVPDDSSQISTVEDDLDLPPFSIWCFIAKNTVPSFSSVMSI
jgi:hypothetical protein